MRKIEIFSAGCSLCQEAIEAVRAASCPSCGVEVRDMTDPAVAADARRLGIHRVPAVVIDGEVADCCATGAIDLGVLHGLGLGQPE